MPEGSLKKNNLIGRNLSGLWAILREREHYERNKREIQLNRADEDNGLIVLLRRQTRKPHRSVEFQLGKMWTHKKLKQQCSCEAGSKTWLRAFRHDNPGSKRIIPERGKIDKG